MLKQVLQWLQEPLPERRLPPAAAAHAQPTTAAATEASGSLRAPLLWGAQGQEQAEERDESLCHSLLWALTS